MVNARTLWEVNVPPPRPAEANNALFVTVVGRQWWWEYTYEYYNGKPIRALGSDGKETDLPVVTANELHIPASEQGMPRPVYLTLKSADVCHSFWVPRLAGKTDLIPGRTNSMWFQTDQPGCTSDNVPSSAAHSTPTCCFGSSSRPRPSSSNGSGTKPARPIAASGYF